MQMPAQGVVYIVHSIDTEGPLVEPLSGTFDRVEHLFGLSGLERTPENLQRLKNKEITLGGGLEEKVAALLSEHSLAYKNSWTEIDKMLAKIMFDDFRKKIPDSFGGGWVYNWHCLDHVGFKTNERGRDLGFHHIFDHYREAVLADSKCQDGIHYHFHYISIYREAHRCATSFLNSAAEFLEVLCRRVIERQWFPTVARAGFQAERPDSHWFLEQWVPYDISNMALIDHTGLDALTDFRKGRSANWRRAPSDWSVYHPSHDDYQLPGQCRRWIGRSLNVLNRMGSIDSREVEKAFAKAAGGENVLLGVAGHDWRNLEPEVDHVRSLLAEAHKKFPNVKFKYSESVAAFRAVTGDGKDSAKLKLEVTLHKKPENDVPYLEIKTLVGKVFGPQPFLAIETKSGRFIHDNLDFAEEGGHWYYAFHTDTLLLKDVKKIGIAANDAFANSFLTVIDV